MQHAEISQSDAFYLDKLFHIGMALGICSAMYVDPNRRTRIKAMPQGHIRGWNF